MDFKNLKKKFAVDFSSRKKNLEELRNEYKYIAFQEFDAQITEGEEILGRYHVTRETAQLLYDNGAIGYTDLQKMVDLYTEAKTRMNDIRKLVPLAKKHIEQAVEASFDSMSLIVSKGKGFTGDLHGEISKKADASLKKAQEHVQDLFTKFSGDSTRYSELVPKVEEATSARDLAKENFNDWFLYNSEGEKYVKELKSKQDKLIEKMTNAKDMLEKNKLKKQIDRFTERVNQLEKTRFTDVKIRGLADKVQNTKNTLDSLTKKMKEAQGLKDRGFQTLEDAFKTFNTNLKPILSNTSFAIEYTFSFISAFIKSVTSILVSFFQPFVVLGTRFGNIFELVNLGYEAYILKYIKGSLGQDITVQELFEQLGKTVDHATESERLIIQHEIQTMGKMIEKGDDVKVISMYLRDIMTPSKRLFIRADKKLSRWFANLVMKYDSWFATTGNVVYYTLVGILKIPNVLISKLLGLALKGAETVIGDLAVSALVDGVTAIAEFTFDLGLKWYGPEGQFIYSAYEVIKNANKIHNFAEFGDQLIRSIIGGYLTDKFTALKWAEYDDTSKTVSDRNALDKDAFEMERIDSETERYTFDYWGKEYIQTKNRFRKNKYPEYTPRKSWKTVVRVPGKYLRLDGDNPNDPDGLLEKCLALEDMLANGTLRDETAKLGNQPGKVSGVFKERKNYVRNLVDFPLYKTEIPWPSTEGMTSQMSGGFYEKETDPTISKLFHSWIVSGTWGPQYNLATNDTERNKAIQLNQADLQNFLKPQRNYVGSIFAMNEWFQRNQGKLAIHVQYHKGEDPTDFYPDDVLHPPNFEKIQRDKVWSVYLQDTKSQRTIWDYIRLHEMDLVVELKNIVLIENQKQKGDIWNAYLNGLNNLGTPMNMNAYHRLHYLATVNRFAFDKDSKEEEEFHKKHGDFLASKLITTGITNEEDPWHTRIPEKFTELINGEIDLVTMFGNMHCRMFIGQFKKQTVAFILFRGTKNLFDMSIDIDIIGAKLGSIQTLDGGKRYKLVEHTNSTYKEILTMNFNYFLIHQGFYRAWKAFRKDVEETLLKWFKDYDIDEYIVSGHSLGGAIAQVACLEIPSLPNRAKSISDWFYNTNMGFKRPHCYVFSSPCVGDLNFGNNFSLMVGESITTYCDADPITMLPPFLIPEANDQALQNIVSIIKTGNFGLLLNAISKMMGVPLGRLLESWDIADLYGQDTARKDLKIRWKILKMLKELNDHRCVHGLGTFIRLNADMDGDFTETDYDPGHSVRAIIGAFRNLDIPGVGRAVNDNQIVKDAVTRHLLSTVIDRLEKVAEMHPELLSILTKDVPPWGDPVIKPKPIRPLPDNVRKILENGTLIGYAKLKRKHDKIEIVNKSEVERYHALSQPIDYGEFEKRRRLIEEF